MKILIGPDSMKGSVTAVEFCQVAKELFDKRWPQHELITIPMADGGEGTVDAFVAGANGEFVEVTAEDPLGRDIAVKYGILNNGETAVIEMAAASGLYLIEEDERNPLYTTTYGTGRLILDAAKKGCKSIVVGIGGSATNDAGIGMLQALGYKCIDEEGNDVAYGGIGVENLYKIIPPENNPVEGIKIKVACDVENCLYGEQGAAYIYAPQKGADEEMVIRLDEALKNFCKCADESLNINLKDLKGGGAAGGLGAALACIGADLMPGFEIVSEMLKLDEHFMNDMDLVITAEGQMNSQSVYGKLPVELAKLANEYGVKTIAVVGCRDVKLSDVEEFGIIGVMPIADKPMSLDYAMANGKRLIYDCLENVLSVYFSTNG